MAIREDTRVFTKRGAILGVAAIVVVTVIVAAVGAAIAAVVLVAF